MIGTHAELTPLARCHAPALYRAFAGHPDLWRYMAVGPFADERTFCDWIAAIADQPDPQYFALRPTGGDWCGMASYLRITPRDGVIEVGNICLGPELQGSTAATEAMVLMMARAFDLGYRRYEWKCNALNLPSRRAAQRLGFGYEGTFRQHMIVKGHNRDTAWFSVIDSEWPALRVAFAAWLSPANFTPAGCQITALSAATRPLVAARDPCL